MHVLNVLYNQYSHSSNYRPHSRNYHLSHYRQNVRPYQPPAQSQHKRGRGRGRGSRAHWNRAVLTNNHIHFHLNLLISHLINVIIITTIKIRMFRCHIHQIIDQILLPQQLQTLHHNHLLTHHLIIILVYYPQNPHNNHQ